MFSFIAFISGLAIVVSPFYLIIGLVNPKFIYFKSKDPYQKNPSRKDVVGIALSIFVSSVIVGTISHSLSPEGKALVEAQQSDTSDPVAQQTKLLKDKLDKEQALVEKEKALIKNREEQEKLDVAQTRKALAERRKQTYGYSAAELIKTCEKSIQSITNSSTFSGPGGIKEVNNHLIVEVYAVTFFGSDENKTYECSVNNIGKQSSFKISSIEEGVNSLTVVEWTAYNENLEAAYREGNPSLSMQELLTLGKNTDHSKTEENVLQLGKASAVLDGNKLVFTAKIKQDYGDGVLRDSEEITEINLDTLEAEMIGTTRMPFREGDRVHDVTKVEVIKNNDLTTYNIYGDGYYLGEEIKLNSITVK